MFQHINQRTLIGILSHKFHDAYSYHKLLLNSGISCRRYLQATFYICFDTPSLSNALTFTAPALAIVHCSAKLFGVGSLTSYIAPGIRGNGGRPFLPADLCWILV